MIGGWFLLLFGRRAPEPPAAWARRPWWSWCRTAARAPTTWLRTAARPPAAWCRSWRLTVSVQLPPTTLTKAVSDDRDFAFDFSPSPELKAGGAIASAVVEGGAGLTLGTPAKNTAVFDGIAIGQAVVVEVAGGTAGATYDLACKATLTTGRVLTIPGRVVVAPDYGST